MLCVVMMNVQLYMIAEPPSPKKKKKSVTKHIQSRKAVGDSQFGETYCYVYCFITLWSDRLCLIFSIQ